ncbi:MAG: thiolase family protein [Saccharolobus sp.]|jgi:acetyl-CoA acetyltransferase|uniref:thiolase family protein n=1 Tax=Saccharolobus sp. TaxID=2100761 RepID=UPI0028CCD60C|nr:thiolase family protein [Saccharolobus sp.]MDT7862044.1 thiolase family protein [Saccharolobus sp.]
MTDVFITGFGEYLEKESNLSFFELLTNAYLEAIKMANIESDEIDGLVFATTTGTIEDPPLRNLLLDQVANFLGFRNLRYMDIVDYGGASFNGMIYRAYRAIKDGYANAILVLGGGKGTIRKKISKTSLITRYHSNFLNVKELAPTSDYAMVALRYSHEYNISDESRALVAVRERSNATLNPNALFRSPISVDDVIKSPIVSYPLRLLECVMPIDGFSAYILTSESKSKKSKITPIKILGFGEAHDPRLIIEKENVLDTPVPVSSKIALERANVSLNDIDLFMLYDAYTIMVLLEIEGIGLAEKGKGWKFVEENDFSPSSTYPINTNGGTLNVGQPAYMSGGVILTEALRQLSGLAGHRQVKDIRYALVNGIGGILNHSTTLILGV